MRKLTVCLFALSLYSCYTFKVPRIYDVGVVDYKRYAERGFFISETDYAGFEYTPVGSVIAIVATGYDEPVEKNKSNEPAFYGKLVVYDIYDAIDAAVEKCTELGADGIIKFKISVEKRSIGGTTSMEGKSFSEDKGNVYTVTGMAIKRK